MEETVAQMHSLIRAGVLAVLVLLALIAVFLERRPRRLTSTLSVVRALTALVGFVALMALSGVAINWLWGAVAAVAGAGLGYLNGSRSSVEPGGRSSLTVRRSVWPMLVLMLGYVLATFTLLYATTGLFSVTMLVVLLGAMLVVGTSSGEMALANGPGPVVTPAAAEDATTA